MAYGSEKRRGAADGGEESGEQGEMTYEELFSAFSEWVEKGLIRAALVLALLLAAAQLVLLIPAVRETLVRVERLEGVPFGSLGGQEGS